MIVTVLSTPFAEYAKGTGKQSYMQERKTRRSLVPEARVKCSSADKAWENQMAQVGRRANQGALPRRCAPHSGL